jgi:hypothetical protein
MKKGLILGFFAVCCLVGCSKEEELSDCEKIVQELDASLNGFYEFAAAYRSESNALIVSDTDVAFEPIGNFFSLKGVNFNLCELKWYKVNVNGTSRELLLYF